MTVILNQIVQYKRIDLEEQKKVMPLEMVRMLALKQPHPLDLASALMGDRVQLIAEVKRASPSRGVICRDFNPVSIAKVYAENNAAAISVLTETRYFQGNLDYLSYINRTLGQQRPPLLRKDFIFDPYQIYESRAYGADALLLIVSILSSNDLVSLIDLSHHLYMKCLVEVHNEDEVKLAVRSGAQIIGINNRDLQTFHVNINTTERLRPLIPGNRIIVSESGIKTRLDMEKLQSWHVNAALVGETLVSSRDIAGKMKELMR
jgi:indole-3-glycerol phosphate synthase